MSLLGFYWLTFFNNGELPAITTTTPIKTLQSYKCLCLACAHGHTLDKPYYKIEIVEESSGCNDVLYYKKLLFWECIQMVGRPKKETVYNSLG